MALSPTASWGGKRMLQAINIGTSLVFFALPAAASRGVAPLALFFLGLAQSPFVPAHNVLKRNWVPADGKMPTISTSLFFKKTHTHSIPFFRFLGDS